MADTMIKNPFNGQLNSNEIFASIFNMVISEYVFADNIKGVYGQLVSDVKTEGTMYGDTKLYYATDILKSYKFGYDNEAAKNLLEINRPADPKCQAITLDQFRQINVTLDNYLSKRAWSTEGSFGQFQSVVLGMVAETKKVYEATLVNAYVGTVVESAAKSKISVDLSGIDTSSEDGRRLEAQLIAQTMADTLVELQDVSRDFNEYGFLRSYDPSDFRVVWNAKYVNKIRKVDLPTIFHKDGLIDKFDERILPARYFGTINTASGKTGTTNTTIRALDEMDVTVGDVTTHLFAGDLLPANASYAANETYTEDAKIICKLVHKEAIKFMSAFEVSTSFFNPRSLTENHYLTWGFSKPDYLKNYPIIELDAKLA